MTSNENIHIVAQPAVAAPSSATTPTIFEGIQTSVSWQSSSWVGVSFGRGNQHVAIVSFEFSYQGPGILTTLVGANNINSDDLRAADYQQFFDIALDAVLHHPDTQKRSRTDAGISLA